jgi:signal transduction histidine kinase
VSFVALVGLGLAAVLGAALGRRLELIAQAEHELRGPVTVILLAVERMRRDPAARSHVEALEPELERLRCALADLTAARRGRRAPAEPRRTDLERLVRRAVGAWRPALRGAGRRARIDWRAGAAGMTADRGRLASAVGNLLANAAEHGDGEVDVSARRTARGIRVEVRNSVRPTPDPARSPGRGRGLRIAARAAENAGGRLEVGLSDGQALAALELPTDDQDAPRAA